jgi:hypothetical protein
MTVDQVANYVLAAAYVLLSISPVWATTSLACWMLRVTFFFCGVHHGMAAAYAGSTTVYFWHGYWDWTAAFLALAQVTFILKDREVITTVRKD